MNACHFDTPLNSLHFFHIALYRLWVLLHTCKALASIPVSTLARHRILKVQGSASISALALQQSVHLQGASISKHQKE
jgi:hypothetical protein